MELYYLDDKKITNDGTNVKIIFNCHRLRKYNKKIIRNICNKYEFDLDEDNEPSIFQICFKTDDELAQIKKFLNCIKKYKFKILHTLSPVSFGEL